MSASINITFFPACANVTAKFEDTQLFPSPGKVDVNNNVPLNEEEVNSILAGNKVEESSKKEEVSEVIIKEPSEPSKIANSTEAKVQTILKVWSKYKAPKTIIKNDIKNDENIVSLDAILSGSDKSKNTPQNDIQSFFSNAA